MRKLAQKVFGKQVWIDEMRRFPVAFIYGSVGGVVMTLIAGAIGIPTLDNLTGAWTGLAYVLLFLGVSFALAAILWLAGKAQNEWFSPPDDMSDDIQELMHLVRLCNKSLFVPDNGRYEAVLPRYRDLENFTASKEWTDRLKGKINTFESRFAQFVSCRNRVENSDLGELSDKGIDALYMQDDRLRNEIAEAFWGLEDFVKRRKNHA